MVDEAVSLGDGGTPGQHPGGQTHVQGTVHIAPTQQRKEGRVRQVVVQAEGGVDHRAGGLGQRGAAKQHGHRAPGSSQGGPGVTQFVG